MACYVMKAWIFHQADYPWGDVPIYGVYICVIRMWTMESPVAIFTGGWYELLLCGTRENSSPCATYTVIIHGTVRNRICTFAYIYALIRTYWETVFVYMVGSVCSLRLKRPSVLCGTIGLFQYSTRALVAIYGSGTRRAWGREALSWSLPISPSSSHHPLRRWQL